MPNKTRGSVTMKWYFLWSVIAMAAWDGIILRRIALNFLRFLAGEPKPFVYTYHPPKLSYSFPERRGKSLTTMEVFQPLSTGWDLHYYSYCGDLRSCYQIEVRGLVKAHTKTGKWARNPWIVVPRFYWQSYPDSVCNTAPKIEFIIYIE